MSESIEEIEELMDIKHAALELLSRYKNPRFVNIMKQIEAIDVSMPLNIEQKVLLNRFGKLGRLGQEMRKKP